jgi:2-haloacid dehalogenase
MLRNSMLASMTGRYAAFDQQGIDALMATARSHGIDVTKDQAEFVLQGFEDLAPHTDVVPALDALAAGGMRCAVLSNSSSRVLAAQIGNAGLDRYFERLISVEEVCMFKPAPQVYLHAAAELGVDIGSMWMVAAHDWDVTGAIRAGARGALVDRGGIFRQGLGEQPEIVGYDMGDVADQILARLV